MNELDERLLELFARPEPDTGREAFAAAVRERIARERLEARVAQIGLGVIAALAAVTLVSFVPETVLYPVQAVQRFVGSPLGAAAGALAAIGLTWWSRFGEI